MEAGWFTRIKHETQHAQLIVLLCMAGFASLNCLEGVHQPGPQRLMQESIERRSWREPHFQRLNIGMVAYAYAAMAAHFLHLGVMRPEACLWTARAAYWLSVHACMCDSVPEHLLHAPPCMSHSGRHSQLTPECFGIFLWHMPYAC